MIESEWDRLLEAAKTLDSHGKGKEWELSLANGMYIGRKKET